MPDGYSALSVLDQSLVSYWWGISGRISEEIISEQDQKVLDEVPRDLAEMADELMDLWEEHGSKQCESCWKPAFHEDEEGLAYCPDCWKDIVDEQIAKLKKALEDKKPKKTYSLREPIA